MINLTHADDRKQEFMRTALELFYEKGYENTKITDICKAMNVTKGAFYYYFESKEAVIIAIATAIKDRAVKMIKDIINREDLTAVDKMNQVFEFINDYKIKEGKIRTRIRSDIESEENLKLRHKLYDLTKKEGLVLYKEIIDQGVEEGVFGDPGNPLELADFFIDTIFSLNTAVHNLEMELYEDENESNYLDILSKLEEKVAFYEKTLERIFQLKKGSFDLRTPYLNRFKKDL